MGCIIASGNSLVMVSKISYYNECVTIYVQTVTGVVTLTIVIVGILMAALVGIQMRKKGKRTCSIH